MRYRRYLAFITISIGLLISLGACSPTALAPQGQKTVPAIQAFQVRLSPIPTIPDYRCGAWSSTNAPSPYGTITIYARLTRDISGIHGATAQAIVHFQYGNQPLDPSSTSDTGGYVMFTLPLEGRQPYGVPATVDVSFSVAGKTVPCSQAFFTPQ